MSIYYLFVLFLFVSIAHSAAVPSQAKKNRNVWTGPVNQVVMAGQDTVLNLDCSTEPDLPARTTRVQWWEYGTRGSGNLISDVAQLLEAHPKFSKYTLTTELDSGIHRLAIKPGTLTTDDGTMYKCTDFYSNDPSQATLGAQLVVIKELPIIITTVTKSIVMEGQYHTIDSLIEFGASYPIAPLMTWTGPTPFNGYSTVTNKTALSGINFYVNRSMEGRTYNLKVNFTGMGFGGQGMADNVPNWEYIYNSLTLSVVWGPKNLYHTPSLPIYYRGTTVTCFADANPFAVYTWVAIGGPVSGRIWQSPYFETTEDMIGENVMRCNAQNTIEGELYTMDLTVIIRVSDQPPPTETVTSTVSTVPTTETTASEYVSW